ncbi:hypothetical protein Tco_1096111 [Tanacetum coccineum]
MNMPSRGRGLLFILGSGLRVFPDSGKPLQDNMADENVPALAPTRSNDQILPFVAWVPIGKSNYVLDLQKKQKKFGMDSCDPVDTPMVDF